MPTEYKSLVYSRRIIDQTWRDDASCQGNPEPWDEDEKPYYDKNYNLIEYAIKVCERCPVVDMCLLDALENDEVGVRGAKTYKQRRDLLRKRTYSDSRN